MVQRDENGKLIIRPRPGRRRREEPMHGVGPSTVSDGHTSTREDVARGSEGVEVRRAVRNGNVPEKVEPPPVRADDRGVLQDWMCGARLRGEKAGLLCRNPKMRGAKRCRMHGSASLVAREKAKERIMIASDHAAKKLIEFMGDDNAPYSVKLAAARDLLDRADLAGKSTVEVEMPRFEKLMAQAIRHRRPGSDDGPRVIEGSTIDPPHRALQPGEEPEPISYAPAGRPNHDQLPTAPAPLARIEEPHIDVTPDVPSYLDPETGGRRRERVGPRTTTMRR